MFKWFPFKGLGRFKWIVGPIYVSDVETTIKYTVTIKGQDPTSNIQVMTKCLGHGCKLDQVSRSWMLDQLNIQPFSSWWWKSLEDAISLLAVTVCHVHLMVIRIDLYFNFDGGGEEERRAWVFFLSLCFTDSKSSLFVTDMLSFTIFCFISLYFALFSNRLVFIGFSFMQHVAPYTSLQMQS